MVGEKFVVANWKMLGGLGEVESFVRGLDDFFSSHSVGCRVVVCPPMCFLRGCITEKSHYYLGGQDCFFHDRGSFTGEISALMLKDLGCNYVILGHSERRINRSESDSIVLRKSLKALDAGLVPIICIGELKKDALVENLSKQISECLPWDRGGFIIAYEPCWAIGNKGFNIPDAEHISRVVDLIRGKGEAYVPVIYGGSVNSSNIDQIMAYRGVDGVLVGRASTELEQFLSIVENINTLLLSAG